MEAIEKLLKPIKLKIMMVIGRGIVAAINNSNMTQLLQLKLLAGELATDVERFENYGFASFPLVDSQALAAFINGNRHHGIVVCVHDRRYRPNYLSSGEVAFYSYEDKTNEHRIHFKNGQIINIKCASLDNDVSGNQTDDIGGSLTVTVGSTSSEQITGSKTIQAQSVQITGSTIQLTATTITLAGNTVMTGNATLGGIAGSGKTLATSDIISIFNNHVHSGIQSGGSNSGAPTTTLASSNMTSNTKAS